MRSSKVIHVVSCHAEGEVGTTSDVNEMTDPVMAGVRAIDAVDPNEPGWRDALAGGVTRSLALDAHGKTLSAAVLDLPLEP